MSARARASDLWEVASSHQALVAGRYGEPCFGNKYGCIWCFTLQLPVRPGAASRLPRELGYCLPQPRLGERRMTVGTVRHMP
eukprot:7384737-Prymnesium_polylepis.1